MRKNKLGFTLGEVLVSLAIIGIIMALAAHTIKMAKSSYTSLTYYALDNVQAIVSTIISGERGAYGESDVKLDKPIINCRKNNHMLASILAPDNKGNTITKCIDAGDTSKNGGASGDKNLFCKYASYLANTNGEIRCGDSDLFSTGFDNNRFEPKITGVIENWDKPNFIAINGQRYYISKWTSDEYRVSDDYGYRIIAVDLNGKSGPNIMEYQNDEILPDIVQFLVLDNGEVYPIGVAGSNVNIGTSEKKTVTYLNTRIKGYNFSYNPTRTENVPANCYSKKGLSAPDLCNFAVLYLQLANNSSFFSYKEALCGAFDGTDNITYVDYCSKNYNGTGAIPRSELCPPSSHEKRVDQCDIKVIKPAFRFNLK